MKDVRAIVHESAKSTATYYPEEGSTRPPSCKPRLHQEIHIHISRVLHRFSHFLQAKQSDWTAYFGYPPDIFSPISLAESQILIQSEPHIVAIESIRRQPLAEQVLLESGGDGGFTAG